MSTNVTVNKNPISITKYTTSGRMVAQDQNSEFLQRRKIRLQQVRQQSKEIAANIRDRVKQEKGKLLQNTESKTEKDLKKFQEKKLQTLRKQHEECIKETGAAHKNAEAEKDPAKILNEMSKTYDKRARDHLKVTLENKTKIDEQRKNKNDILEKHRQYSKEMEKTRATLVVGINKQQTSPQKKRKKKSTKFNDTFNSDIENASPIKVKQKSPKKPKRPIFNQDIQEVRFIKTPKSPLEFDRHDVSEKQSNVDVNENPEKHLKIDDKSSCIECNEKSEIDVEHPEKDDKINKCSGRSKSCQTLGDRHVSECDNETCPYISPLPHDRAILHPATPPTQTDCICESQFSSTSTLTKDEIRKLIDDHRPQDCYCDMEYPKCTKISDRIRQRSEQRMQNINLEPVTIAPSLSNYSERKKFEMKNIPIVDIRGENESKLPYVPQTSLKSKLTVKQTQPSKQSAKTKYSDNKSRVPPSSVQKLDKTCVEVDTSVESRDNADFAKNMLNQDQRAKERGEKALKRAQVQNDYKQLMKELPVLQRQERLAGMKSHNPEFHLTDERLNELERRRQNKIENIFEKYYHKSKSLETPIITIRPVQKEPPDENMKLPFTALDVSEDLQAFNYGQWKSENPSSRAKPTNRKTASSTGRVRTESKVPEVPDEEDEECRQKCLVELLQRLNKQRDLLLQEVQNLPPSSNLKKILQDDALINLTTDDSESSTVKPKFVSASTSPTTSPELESKKSKGVKSKKRQGTTTATSTESTESKPKKRQKPKEKKSRMPTTISKNDEGTQTSPSIRPQSPPVKDTTKNKVSQEQQTQPDDLRPIEEEQLCEIIIKMCDESKVKVSTQPIGSYVNIKEKELPPQHKQINCDMSSSTSYLSPPLICPKYMNQNDVNEKYKSEYKDTLYGKPKQTNIDTFSKQEHKDERLDHIKYHPISKQKNVKSHTPTKIINPQLLNYIKKLLSMSRKSIDDLTVSSISDVSSPSPQITECQENNPLLRLQDVMNHYNLTFADIQQQLSNSTSSSVKSEQNQEGSNTNAEMDKIDGEDSAPTSDDIDYNEILTKYQEVTRSCVDKISTLTLMIDRIRAEKEKIFSPNSLDFNENSLTSYFELPPQKSEKSISPTQECNKNCTSTSNGSNKSYSLTQEEIDRYFLEIGPSKKDRDQVDNNNQGDTKEPFVPMLKGIPKYSNDPIVNPINLIPKTRPPASLKNNVQRYNLNIDMTPHELSTIVEMDTACNSKNFSDKRPKSPDDQIPSKDSNTSTNSGFITISPEVDTKTSPTKSERRKTPRSKNTKNSELSGLQLLSSISDNTSSSSPENFENILRTMGLGWAISTLKKTQEALALSSSSSSDSSIRKHVSLNNTSVSDVTLKDVLNREFLKKLSSSSSSSNSPTLQELLDLSDAIGAAQSKDRSNTQRTSTPVQQSKSTDSKKDLFASVSDISSVRHSDENMFLSIPDISLDTNRSLK